MRVKGEGPVPSSIMLVGEGPGKMESATGRPFVETAPAGAELTRYFNGYTLPLRSQVYITNLVKEWEGGAATKKQEVTSADIARDGWELEGEVEFVDPMVIVTLGAHSTRYFLGDVDMEAVHGLFFKVKFPWERTRFILPVYHPAAGLHQPEMAAKTAFGMHRLAQYWANKGKGTFLFDQCWKPWPMKPKIHDCLGAIGVPPAIDTEGTPGQLWCSSMSDGQTTGVAKGVALELPYPEVIYHNAMWDMQVLWAQGAKTHPDLHDTMVMAYNLCLEPQGLKALAYRHLGYQMTEYQDLVGKEMIQFSPKTGKPLKKTKWVLGTLDDIPHEKAIQYAGEDAWATARLYPILSQMIDDAGLRQVYDIDRAVLPLYAMMEATGLPVDLDHFTEFSGWLEKEMVDGAKTLQLISNRPDFNPGSSDQVADYLFNQLGIPGGKKTPTGDRFSTNDKILQALKGTYPEVEAIIDWREIQKLKTAFVDKVPTYVRGGRLYFRLLPTRVVSGRLAAKDPNVLALPKHSDLGKRFRAGIRAPEGRLLGSWDLSQIELRVLAVDSGSEKLLQLFNDDVDLHAFTAQRIFGVPPQHQNKSLHRLPAKAVNFGIPMGMTCTGLAAEMRKNQYPFPEILDWIKAKGGKALKAAQELVCQGWIDEVTDAWGIEPYIESKKAEARQKGFVRDMWGRIRYLPSVLSPNDLIREEALRQAQSFPMQAGARGVMKQIEKVVWDEVIRVEGDHPVLPLLDIHDDLLLEFSIGQESKLVPMVKEIYETTVKGWPIPILCSGDVGKRWSDL